MSSKRRSIVIAALAAGLLVPALTVAQSYPDRPIRMIVGFPPGGGNDIMARLVAARMQESWAQPVVVENKPGASSIIATEYVAKSAPDGYTLLVNATGGMTVNPALHAKLPFDTVRDFAPVSAIGLFPVVLAVHPSLPVKTVQELIAHAKAHPGKLNYGAGASAFQVAMEMFKLRSGTDLRHIPFKGSAQTVNALVAGDVNLVMVDSAPILPHVRSGRVRALAVTTAARDEALPEVPTLAEAGVADYELSLWVALFAPARTPPEIVRKLNAEIQRITALADVREKLRAMGVKPVANTPEALGEMVRSEVARYREVVSVANIKAE